MFGSVCLFLFLFLLSLLFKTPPAFLQDKKVFHFFKVPSNIAGEQWGIIIPIFSDKEAQSYWLVFLGRMANFIEILESGGSFGVSLLYFEIVENPQLILGCAFF